MGRRVTFAEIVYKPLLLIFLIPAVYLFGSAYIASMQPSSDCSFVPLFVALGIILAACAGVILLNLFSVSLYIRTEKRIFAFFSAVLDFVSASVSAIIGIELLSDGAPVGMRIVFIAIALACAACFVINVVHVFRKG
jgi:hypothetical protein